MNELLLEYNKPIEWNLAGLFRNDNIYFDIFKYLSDNNIPIPIKYVYGSPMVTLEGGRRTFGYTFGFESYEYLINQYTDYGISVKLPFSNHLITEKDYTDPELLKYFELLNNLNNNSHIILTNEDFAKFLQDNYPNIKITCSVIKPALDCGWGNETLDYYNNLCEKYDTVVLNTGKALDKDFVTQLKYPQKLEVIVNSRCMLNCPMAGEHYQLVAEWTKYKGDQNKTMDKAREIEEFMRVCKENHFKNPLAGSNLTFNQINDLIDIGITQFKLEGRDWEPLTLIRDLGVYVFDNQLFTRLCNTLNEGPV